MDPELAAAEGIHTGWEHDRATVTRNMSADAVEAVAAVAAVGLVPAAGVELVVAEEAAEAAWASSKHS